MGVLIAISGNVVAMVGVWLVQSGLLTQQQAADLLTPAQKEVAGAILVAAPIVMAAIRELNHRLWLLAAHATEPGAPETDIANVRSQMSVGILFKSKQHSQIERQEQQIEQLQQELARMRGDKPTPPAMQSFVEGKGTQ